MNKDHKTSKVEVNLTTRFLSILLDLKQWGMLLAQHYSDIDNEI